VYPVASSQIASRPDERRRNPRHTASAIVYVHLGPDNGGIIINLGIDGVACQAARKLSAKINSILNVRLRGSGLDVNLIGEIIWQGASQKEIGICFKDLPASQQQVIADWIARQEQASKAPLLDDFPPPKPMPAMPEVFAPGVGYVPRAYSAAFPIPQAKPAGPPSGAAADAIIDSRPPAPVDSAGGVFAATPRLEIVSPIQDRNVPSEELAAHSQGRNADPLGSSEPSRPVQPLPVQPLSEKLSIERSHQVSAGNSPPIVPAKEPIATVLKALSQASAEAAGKTELRKPEEIKPIPQDRVFLRPESLLEANAAEKWIPPALLAAWRRGRLQHKLLLGSAAAVSLGFFVLILTLALAHVGSSASNSSGSGSPQQPTAQQSTTPPPPTNVSVVPPQADPMQAPPPPAAVPSRSHQRPQPSPFANFVKTVFGFDLGNSDASNEIDEDQLRVQVWTSKDSGYYYCTDDGYYKNVQPGTFMSQGDALQSGYRSRLGQFCD
jgi:hypothetical protein